MKSAGGQLPLDLPFPAAVARSDFLVSDSNREAVARIDDWPGWPSPVLVLHGPPGCGKTHLAHLWCQRAAAQMVAGPALAEASVSRLLVGSRCRIAVDNADQAPERALLHLHNYCCERGGSLLVTAGRPPGSWKTALADLRSRLRAAAAVGIAMPDDALLAAVLVKHFADRQLRVRPALVAYLVTRIERSFAGAAEIVAALDAEALAEGRAVEIALAHRLFVRRGQSLPGDCDPTVT